MAHCVNFPTVGEKLEMGEIPDLREWGEVGESGEKEGKSPLNPPLARLRIWVPQGDVIIKQIALWSGRGPAGPGWATVLHRYFPLRGGGYAPYSRR